MRQIASPDGWAQVWKSVSNLFHVPKKNLAEHITKSLLEPSKAWCHKATGVDANLGVGNCDTEVADLKLPEMTAIKLLSSLLT